VCSILAASTQKLWYSTSRLLVETK